MEIKDIFLNLGSYNAHKKQCGKNNQKCTERWLKCILSLFRAVCGSAGVPCESAPKRVSASVFAKRYLTAD